MIWTQPILRVSAGGLAMAVTSVAVIHLGRPPNPTAVLGPRTVVTPRGAVTGADAPSADDVLARAIADDAPLPVDLASPAVPDPTAPEAADVRVLEGPMEAILYPPATATPGATASVVAQALRLFAYKLDLTRDLALGDRVRLLVRDGRLDYAELDGARGPVRLYRIGDSADLGDAFADAQGASLRRLLLRTPLLHRRLTSGFGLRLHPLLGYTRMHQGVDFGAPTGTAVMAAADGVVEAARWAGGYGRWVRLRHAGGYETAYAHLSAWAPGLGPGVAVHQGEVIGWTGESGLATGPHLHFEVWKDGQPIDPAMAGPLRTTVTPQSLAAFEAQRRVIDALLEGPSSS